MRLSLAAAALVLSTSAWAETTAATGQPLCTTVDGLHEYILALIKKDKGWLGSVEGCAMVKGGLRMEVIDKGDATSGMHVDKVRVFGPKGSATGYTMNVDP